MVILYTQMMIGATLPRTSVDVSVYQMNHDMSAPFCSPVFSFMVDDYQSN